MSKILKLLLRDYDDAAGTNGGDAFLIITVFDGTQPMTSFRYDVANEDREDQITVTDRHGDECMGHIQTACAAMCAMFTEFERLGDLGTIEGFYSEVFMQNDIDATECAVFWNTETNEFSPTVPPIEIDH